MPNEEEAVARRRVYRSVVKGNAADEGAVEENSSTTMLDDTVVDENEVNPDVTDDSNGDETIGDEDEHGSCLGENQTTVAVLKSKRTNETFDNAISDIAVGMSLVVLPMLILPAVFIGLVLGWQIDVPSNTSTQSSQPFSKSLSLVNKTQSTSDAFFVDISSARLATVSSWMSTATSFLAPWVMTLFSYYVASAFLKDHRQPARLPTPYQLRLLIGLSDGSYGPLWSWFLYRTAHRERNRGNPLLAVTVGVFLLCNALSICIFLADTWLHLTTTTVQLLESTPSTGNPLQLSRSLSAACQSSGFCTLLEANQTVKSNGINNASEAYKVLFNTSTEHSILSTTIEHIVYSFYAAADIPQNVMYRGSALAMTTQCSPISTACNLTEVSECPYPCFTNEPSYWVNHLPFNCSSALQGDLVNTSGVGLPNSPYYDAGGDTNFFLTYFLDSWFTQHVEPTESAFGHIDVDQYFVTTQPAHFAVGAHIVGDPALYSDPEIVIYTDSRAASFLLACSTQVIEMNYTYANGEISDVVVGPTIERAIAAITNPSLTTGDQGWDSLTMSTREAALVSDSQSLADAFARAYGHTVLSLGSGAVVASSTIQESTQLIRQISRMPEAPFIALIILNCLYALLGLALGSLALALKPKEIKPVQERLTVTGLVAALFEGERAHENVTKMSKLFAENDPKANIKLKVVMERTEKGGWRYDTIR